IDVTFDKALPQSLRAATLNLGSNRALTLSSASISGATLTWSGGAQDFPRLTLNAALSLSLVLPSTSPPAAPTGLTVTPGDTSMSVSWTAPTDTVTGYDVHYTSAAAGAVGNNVAASGSNPAAAWVAVTRSGTTASQTISSLSNGTAYRVRVRAVNTIGNSAWVFGTGTPQGPPTVSLSAFPNPVREGSPVTVTARLSRALSNAVTIPVSVTPGTAESGDHGSLTSITVAAGATTGTGTISTTEDADEEDETFTVALGTLPSSLTAGSRSSVQVTISEGPTVSLSVSPTRVTEGESVTVTATLTEALSEDLTVYFDQSRGTSEPVDDYELFSSLTIPAGRTIGRSGFATKHDVDPDDETFTVSVSHTSYVWQDGEGGPRTDVSVGSPSSVEVTIVDDDTTEVTLEAEHASVAEGESNYITLRFSEPVPLNRGILNGDPKVTVWVRVTDTGTGALLARVPVVVKGNMTEPGFHAANDVDEDGDDESVTVTLET
ncbi:MAG: fibronectin type III domain-containing protein, partial [Chloroflexi bacterium]|nr:fibronectin type III domain-containing protein [Chloroflexota bacterium]